MSDPENEIILSGSEETLKPIITLLVGISQLLDNQQAFYGIPIEELQAERTFKPQVSLFFRQDETEVKAGYSPVKGYISFRLMGKTNENLTPAYINSLAQKIKSKFGGTATPFVWQKGKNYYSYTDKPKGYQLKLLCPSQAEAKRIVEQVLDLQGHTPDWENLQQTANAEPDQKFPPVPKKATILGKSVRLPRRRPVARVKFRSAHLHVWGLNRPIKLVSGSALLNSNFS